MAILYKIFKRKGYKLLNPSTLTVIAGMTGSFCAGTLVKQVRTMDYEGKKIFLTNFAFILATVGIIYFVSRFMLAYLLPFVIGIMLAFVMQKPARFFAAHTHIKTGIWAAILVVVTYILITGLGMLIIWQTVRQFGHIAKTVTAYIENTSGYFSQAGIKYQALLAKLPPNVAGAVQSFTSDSAKEFVSGLTAIFSQIAKTTARNLPAFLISTVVTVVASCYIAKDYMILIHFFRNMVSPKIYRAILEIKDIFVGSLLKLILGYLILMFITFIELTVGFMLCGVRYAVLIALAVALIDVLPVLGTGTILVPWAIYEFVLSNGEKATGLIVLYIIITIIRNFLEPRIIGRQMGINPLLTLITMFVGLRIGGLPGMFFLPITVIVILTYYKKQLEDERSLAGEESAEDL